MVVVDKLFHHKLYNGYIKRTSKFMAYDDQNQCKLFSFKNYSSSVNLCNNSLWGRVSEEIGKLKELEVLDLGYNNFSGSLPINLGNNFPSSSPLSSSPSKSFVPSPSPVLTPISRPETLLPPLSHPSLPPSPNMIPHNHSKHMYRAMIWSGVGGSFFFVPSALGIFFCRRNKVVMVGPWATGLSGQLRKAFVIGVPKLQRSELVTSCEDFSNIIGSLSDGTVYKRTFSSGVEIAVISTAMKFAEDWSKSLEGQFRKKIATLSRVNHKNFVNLIGFCEEEQPFTRMMVFEYALNGTLFEHLHSKFHPLLMVSSVTDHVRMQDSGAKAADFDDDDGGGLVVTLPLPMNGQAAIPTALLPTIVVSEPIGFPMDPEYDLEIKGDVESECSKYGPILHIHFRAATSQRPVP
ncbi:probable inactive receptor-like protein kinase At3g56050 [Impatiens glandulifera]|uniref:probable inactive receptor-like protein kinase At3g56050 n=1 Tax=Impatiens glandulifera TaxID=253017 RepID=UPI001FB105C5|nr:probable inactive receptor-like protein kinase At3g56050 [Impatiens glandulifera]